jgi:pimeloyl-ACP methyl ester carboxylesterase
MSQIDRPVLLLLGSESPPDVRAAVDAVDAALPDSEIAILEGQGHFAHVMNPELLAREIVGFVSR